VHRGFIKLYRKSFDSIVWKNQKLWRFWTWCLLKATHRERDEMIGYQKVKLLPGQFVFGRKASAQSTGLSERNIRTCISILKQHQKLTIKSTNKFSIITLLNWDTYNSDEIETTTKPTTKRPASDHQTTTNKNVEECRRMEKNKPKGPSLKKTIEYPNWLNKKLWKDYKDHRRQLKPRMTQRAEELAIIKLKKLIDAGDRQEDIINQSIEQGWKGLFQIKDKVTPKTETTINWDKVDFPEAVDGR
jgi:hypothetical protein